MKLSLVIQSEPTGLDLLNSIGPSRQGKPYIGTRAFVSLHRFARTDVRERITHGGYAQIKVPHGGRESVGRSFRVTPNLSALIRDQHRERKSGLCSQGLPEVASRDLASTSYADLIQITE
jgi:hypothetical protein